MEKQPAPESKHATDFLANERTFLAWIRTSVAVISLGFVIAKFRIWIDELARTGSTAPAHRRWDGSFQIGLGMMALGGLLTLLAAWRYHAVNQQIERGTVRPDRALIVFVTILVAVLAAVMIITMLVTTST